jgi:uncharacterized membrane protein YbhN (UPF0104 family)
MASKPAIRNYIFLAIAFLLIYLVFRNVDFKWMWHEIRHAHFGWIGLSIGCGIVAMASRAWRWRLLLEPLGYKPSFLHCFYGVSIGYFANIAFPRMGEVVRCTILHQSDSVPVNQSFGTVILERLIDLLMLFSLIIIVLASQWDVFGTFFLREIWNPKQEAGTSSSGLRTVILISALFIALVGVLLFCVYRKKIMASERFLKLIAFLKGIPQGLGTLFKMKKKGWFIFHTLFIWFNYFLMTWVCVFSYEPTKFLNAFDGLFLMVVGGLGMTAPVQGGFGAFHYLVEKALLIYGIQPGVDPVTGTVLHPGLVFATIVHSGQFIMTVFTGAISLLLFTLYRRKKTVYA